MADRKYYVLCEANCKFESMTKEQILTAIEQAISKGEIKDVDTGFVSTLKEKNGGSGISFWIGTQSEYNAAVENGVDLTDVFCIVTDDTTEEDLLAEIEYVKKAYVEDIENLNTNKAPNGYGLGSAKKISAAELDTFCSPAWFYIDGEKTTIGGVTANYWFGYNTAVGRGTDHSAQHIRGISGRIYTELVRTNYHGVWGEWEWETPPMIPNVEYRTTKRHNNKSVYVKRVIKTFGDNLIVSDILASGVSEIVATKLNYIKNGASHILYDVVDSAGIGNIYLYTHINSNGEIGLMGTLGGTSEGVTISFDIEYTKD